MKSKNEEFDVAKAIDQLIDDGQCPDYYYRSCCDEYVVCAPIVAACSEDLINDVFDGIPDASWDID